MEKHILALESPDATHKLDEDDIEDKALEMAIEEVYEATGRKWKPWANNARSIRMGDIILIVDSDTVVPEVSCWLLRYKRNFASQPFLRRFLLQDCFRDAARELAESPDVAIIQHESGQFTTHCPPFFY
jgi:hypothetical protein